MKNPSSPRHKNLNNVSRAELLSLIKQLQKENAELKNAQSNRNTSNNYTINSLRSELQDTKNTLIKTTQALERAGKINENWETTVGEMFAAIKDNESLLKSRLALGDIVIIGKNDINFIELRHYLVNYVAATVQAVSSLNQHMAKSLNLSRSEKNNTQEDTSSNNNDTNSDAADLSTVNINSNNLDAADEQAAGSEAEIILSEEPDRAEQQEHSGAEGNREPKSGKEAVSTRNKRQPSGRTLFKRSVYALLDLSFNKDGDISAESLYQNISFALSAKDDISAGLVSVDDLKQQAQQAAASADKSVVPENCTSVIGPVRGIEIKRWCSGCHKIHTIKINGVIDRVNLTVTMPMHELLSRMVPVHFSRCPECGRQIEITPASLTSATLYSVNNEALHNQSGTPYTKQPAEPQEASVSNAPQDNPAYGRQFSKQETPHPEPQKTPDAADSAQPADKTRSKILLRDIINNEQVHKDTIDLRSMLINVDGISVIDPVQFKQKAWIFAELPAFKNNRISNGLTTSLIAYFSFLTVPKSRMHTFLDNNGYEFTKQQLVEYINSSARAVLHPMARHIHKILLSNCSVLQADETTIINRELKTKNGSIKKSQIWALASGRSEAVNAVYFHGTSGRNHEHAMKLLGCDMEDLPKVACRFLTTDSYSGYAAALRKLNADQDKYAVVHTACLVHARRPLHRYLSDCGLLPVYQRLIKNGGFKEFLKNLDAERAAGKSAALTEKNKALLRIYYLINAAFAVDGSAAEKFNRDYTSPDFMQHLKGVRKSATAGLLAFMYQQIEEYVDKYQPFDMKEKKLPDGRNALRLKCRPAAGEGPALMYLINVREKLLPLIEHPEVELSTNNVERSLRLGCCARHNMQFLDTTAGLHAFTDCLTIASTCIRNNLSLEEYLLWYWANIKVRMEDYMLTAYKHTHGLYERPARIRVKEKDRVIVTDIYDEEYRCCYDHISQQGLSPMDMSRYLRMRSAK